MEHPLALVLVEIADRGPKKPAWDASWKWARHRKVDARDVKKEPPVAEEFNINSPKQLGEIAFWKLGLPLEYTKKTKTGYSTADVLERSAPIAPIVKKILDYRQIAKIQSTYVIGLQDWILADGKIHAMYRIWLRPVVCLVDQTYKISLFDWNKGRLIRKELCVPEWGG